MDPTCKAIVWQQFGAAIDMLESAVIACPDALWADRAKRPEFWYVTFHTLFFLDYYLSNSVDTFMPPAPFTLDELDPAGVMPERPYTKPELQAYLDHGRQRCRVAISTMTREQARERRRFSWGEVSVEELLLYNMRHVQHHTGQLNLMLRQAVNGAPGWVAGAKQPLD